MDDILRLYWGQIAGFIIFIIAVFAIWKIFSRHLSEIGITPEQERRVRKWRNSIILILTVVVVLGILNSLSVNRVNRSIIDRSGVDEQQQEFEKRHRQADTSNSGQGGSR